MPVPAARPLLERAAVGAATLTALWLLWGATSERFVAPFGIRTRFGLLGWQVVDGGAQPGVARILPWHAVGFTEHHALPLTLTVGLTAIVLVAAGVLAVRLERNRRPRGVCVRCGHQTREGSSRLVVCPECGAFPNARANPFS